LQRLCRSCTLAKKARKTIIEVIVIGIDWPAFGEMIKLMRAYIGSDYSQAKLAEDLLLTRGGVSNYETGVTPCPPEMRMTIRRKHGMEYLPTDDLEVDVYEKALVRWNTSISKKNWEEANFFREKLGVIKAFPFLKKQNASFSMYDCRMFISLNELDSAKQILDEYENRTGEFDDTQKYYYYRNKGIYNGLTGCIEDASKFYHKAIASNINMLDDNISIYLNAALCDEQLGFVSLSIDCLEEGLELYPTGQDKTLLFRSYSLIGRGYTSIKIFHRAEKMHDKAYEIAFKKYEENADEESKLRLGVVHLDYGRMYLMKKEYMPCIENLDKALNLIPTDNDDYLEATYHRIRCFIAKGDTSHCPQLISAALKVSRPNKTYNMMFKALEILENPSEESAKHLEEKILPYLLEQNCFHPALDYAMFLTDYYKTRGPGFVMRALKMSELVSSIHRKFMERGAI